MGVNIGSTAGYMCLDSWVMAKIIQLGIAPMMAKTVKRGSRAGQKFWGCSNYLSTGCPGSLPFK